MEPYSNPPAVSHRRRTIAILAIIAVLITLAALAAYTLMPKEDHVLLVPIGLASGSAAFELDLAEGSAVLPSYAWLPEGQLLTDAVTLPQGTYVLLMQGSGGRPVANVFKKDGASLTQITDSGTMKYSLAGNPETGELAFMSAPIETETDITSLEEADIMVLVPGGTERRVGSAGNLVGFAGGELAVTRGTDLYVYGADALAGNAPPVSLNVTALFPATDGSRLALLNPITQAVDVLDVTLGFTGMSYQESFALAEGSPTAFGFDGDTLMALGPVAGEETFFVTVLGTDGSTKIPKPAAQSPGVPLKLISTNL